MFLASEFESSPFSVCSWRRMVAAICWFSSSTLASASEEIAFSLSSEVCSPLIVMLALLPFSPALSSRPESSAFLFFSAAKSSCRAERVDLTSCFGCLFEGEQLGEFGDLGAELAQGRILARRSHAPGRNCATMKTDRRKVMTSSSCAIASTKPGQ